MAENIKNGILFKRRQYLKEWRPRYFVLDEEVLRYFRISDSLKDNPEYWISECPIASIYLPGCSINVEDPFKFKHKNGESRMLFPFTISHHTSPKIYKLSATKKCDTEAWISVLQNIALTSPNPFLKKNPSIVGDDLPRISNVTADSSSNASFVEEISELDWQTSKHVKQIERSEIKDDSEDQAGDEKEIRLVHQLPQWLAHRAEAMIQSLLSLADTDEGWEFAFCRQAITVHTIPGRIVTVRAQGDIPFPAQLCLKCILDPTQGMPAIDAMLVSISVIEKYDAHTDHSLFRYRGLWPTAPRDLCLFSHWCMHVDGRLILTSCSVPHANCPETPGVVRAEAHIAGWIFKPSKDGSSCKATYMLKTDLKGSLGKRITDLASKDQAMLVASLIKHLQKMYAPSRGGIPEVAILNNESLEAFICKSLTTEQENQHEINTTGENNAKCELAQINCTLPAVNRLFQLTFLLIPAILPFLWGAGVRGIVFVITLYICVSHLCYWKRYSKTSRSPNHGQSPIKGQCIIDCSVKISKLLKLLQAAKKIEDNAVKPSLMHYIIRSAGIALRDNPRLKGTVCKGEWCPSSSVSICCSIPAKNKNHREHIISIQDADKKSVETIATEARKASQEAQVSAVTEQDGIPEKSSDIHTWIEFLSFLMCFVQSMFEHLYKCPVCGWIFNFNCEENSLTSGTVTIVSSQKDTQMQMFENSRTLIHLIPSNSSASPIFVSISGVTFYQSSPMTNMKTKSQDASTQRICTDKDTSPLSFPIPFLNMSISCHLDVITSDQLQAFSNSLCCLLENPHFLENDIPE